MRRLSIVGLLRRLFRVVSVMALISAPASAQQIVSDLSARPIGRVHFNSVTPRSKWELVYCKSDKMPTPVRGTSYLSENLQGPMSAMMISHGSAGPQQEDVDRWVRLFNQIGIVAFVVDSFGPHGIANTTDNQSQLNPAVNDADALFALKLLSTDPRIDPKRIGQIGLSCGGGVSLDITFDTFRKGVIDSDTRFAALIGFYPGCSVLRWETPPPPLTGAPFMLVLGEKDDYIPAQLYRNATEIMQCDGQTVEVYVYPGAYHDFDNTRARFKYFLGATTARDCSQTLIGAQHDAYYRLPNGEKYANLQAIQADYTRCITRGVSTGVNLEQAKCAEADVNALLVKAMGLSPR